LYLDSSSLEELSGLIGQPWGCVTGERASEAPGLTLFAWAEVTTELTGQAWTISSVMTGLDFEGFGEDYPCLRVSPGGSGLKAAQLTGRSFHQHHGETVEAIYVVRETITRTVDGQDQWEFSTDYAVVFSLSAGAVAIAKGGHHDEALFVHISVDVESLQIPDRSNEWNWDNQLGESYQVQRVWLPIDEILTGSA
jgi:hypothetical protein